MDTKRVPKIPGANHPIALESVPERIVVRLAGRTIADTRRALGLRESDYPVVYYVPRDDVDMSLLVRTNHATHCPYKGDAAYFSITAGDRRSDNAVWTYENPYPAVAAIKEYVAFYPSRVDAIEVGEAAEENRPTAMIGILLAAVAIPNFTPERALQVLSLDDETVAACSQVHPRSIHPSSITLALVSRDPELVLVEMFDPCACGEQNCPFWIYRVRGTEDERLLTSYAYDVKIVRSAGSSVPDVVETSHWSAAISNATEYRYRNGTYVASQSWKVRGDERKPAEVKLRFAGGTSSVQLHGKVGLDWGDVYTLDAAKGQSLEISALRSRRPIVVRLRGGGTDRTVTAGSPVVLPATGTYTVDVELGKSGDVDDDAAYAFTLSIR